MSITGAGSLDIEYETKRILLRSRQATTKPSPEASPVSSPHGSMEDLTKIADQKADLKDRGFLDREVHLQEIDPEKFFTLGSEVWRYVLMCK